MFLFKIAIIKVRIANTIRQEYNDFIKLRRDEDGITFLQHGAVWFGRLYCVG